MLKAIIGIILFLLIAFAIVAAVIIRFMYKGVRNLKEIQEEIINTGGKKMNRQEYIRYQQREKAKRPFDDDYFKSSDRGKNKENQEEKRTTTRRTTTDSGVTIIDDRETEGKKKIFDHDDGEYVEFEEIR